MTQEEMIERGKVARAFLDNPIFAEMLREVQDDFVQRWLDNTDERIQYASWASIHALAEMEAKLREIGNNGLFAEEQAKRP